MKKLTTVLVLIGALSVGSGAATTSVVALSDSSAQAQARFRSRLSDRQLQVILTRIRTNADSLVRIVDGTPARGRAWGNYNRQPGDVAFLVEDLSRAANHLDDHIFRQVATRADVDDIFRRAALVDDALRRQPPRGAWQSYWNNIRRDVDSLASAYSVAWDWRNPQYDTSPLPGLYRAWQGTYALDVARSDNPQRTIDAAMRTVPVADRARASRQLTARLDPPDLLAISRSGPQFTIESSRGPQLTFQADNQSRTEQGPGGNMMTTRAALFGDQLNITTTGNLNNEFTVTFEPMTGGQTLRVTRNLYSDYLRQPVTLQTVYRKTSDTADWNLYRGDPPARPGRWNESMLVPDGTVLVARLDQSVGLRSVREDDRITLTVRNAPRPELEGATIEGYIVSTPVRQDNRLRVAVDFDQIRLRNGRYGNFDGIVERVTAPNGQAIAFNGEVIGVDRSSNDALQRGAIGAAIGGLIGALAGGGKGALIGAAIGGGGAAATVLIDDNGQVELVRGTEFTIRARAR